MNLPELDLTKTQKKIVELVCYGCTYEQIADELFVDLSTIKKHITASRKRNPLCLTVRHLIAAYAVQYLSHK